MYAKQELKNEIFELHQQGLSNIEIAARIGMAPNGVSYHLKSIKKTKKLDICPDCGRKDLPIGSVFCYNCGMQILSEGQRHAIKLKELLRDVLKYIPETEKDNARDILISAAIYLEKL